jgi:hypothetical protein
MACGTITVASNTALEGVMPEELRFKEGDAHSLAETLAGISRMTEIERKDMRDRLRTLAKERYSLTALISRVIDVLS